MRKKAFLPLAALMLLLVAAIPTRVAQADMGPKPDMHFTLVYNISSVSVVDAKLYFCEDENCAASKQVLGPFNCDEDSCYYGYGGQGFYKLTIKFNDITRESNVFQKRGFVSNFKVEINENDLSIKQTNIALPYELSAQFRGFLIALVITLGIELPLAGFLLKKWKLQARWRPILVINLVTLPFVWFVFSLLSNPILVIGLGEIFAFITEAAFYRYAFHKDGITKRQAVILSLAANGVSFLIPSFLLLLLLILY